MKTIIFFRPFLPILLLCTAALSAQQIVPYAEVDEPPVPAECLEAEDRADCYLKSLQEIIRKNFRYPEEAQMRGIKGRVNVSFVITPQGKIIRIVADGPHELLANEAFRLAQLFPNVLPGRHQGKPVFTSYSIPIVFALQEFNRSTIIRY